MDSSMSMKIYSMPQTPPFSISSNNLEKTHNHPSILTKICYFKSLGTPLTKVIWTLTQKLNSIRILSNKKSKTWKLKIRSLKEYFRTWSNLSKITKKSIQLLSQTKNSHRSPLPTNQCSLPLTSMKDRLHLARAETLKYQHLDMRTRNNIMPIWQT